MANKRTRRQKEKAQKRRVTSNLSLGSNTFTFDPSVKGQTNLTTTVNKTEAKIITNAQDSVKYFGVTGIRKNIYKSLILSALILGTELVLYFILK